MDCDTTPGGSLMSNGEVWPNFYIVGAARSGTTSLYDALRKHPQVFLPEVKEPHYFTYCPGLESIPSVSAHQYVCCGNREMYQKLYCHGAGFAAIGDVSPSYLWDKCAPRKIREVALGAKIIAILRDPVDRAHSQYLLNHLNGVDQAPSFAIALQEDAARDKSSWMTARLYIEAGLYHAQVLRYLEAFGEDQVLILSFNDLTHRRGDLLSALCRFIGVDPGSLSPLQDPEAQNASKMARFPTAYKIATRLGLRKGILPESVRNWLGRSPWLFDKNKPPLDGHSRKLLQDIYEPDLVMLEKLLGRSYPELRQSWN